MLCARFLRDHVQQHSRLYLAIEGGFDAMLSGYWRTFDVVLRYQAITLAVFFRDLGVDGHLGYRDSQRFLSHSRHRNDRRPRGGSPGSLTSQNDAVAARVAGFTFQVHPHMLRRACGYKRANTAATCEQCSTTSVTKNIQDTVAHTALASDRFKGFWGD